jgi:two-component system response regulator GlrR
MKTQSILLFDFSPRRGWGESLKSILGREPSFSVRHVTAPQTDCIQDENSLNVAFQGPSPDATFLCVEMARVRCREHLLQPCAARTRVLIVVSDAEESEEVDEFLSKGAAEFLVPPVRTVDVIPRLHRLLGVGQDDDSVRQLKTKLGLQNLVGQSPELFGELKKLPLIAGSDASALILGETGTGKELCARAIHYLSSRSAKPFVPVNCGAIPLELVENELFGHAAGAFTGATMPKAGLVQEAADGTLFLDEIDALPASAQVKLLRFLQDGEFRPLGSTKGLKSDVRVIAASNTNLDAAVHKNRFRADLYYRLGVVILNLPPLRSRGSDISLLSRHLLQKFCAELNKAIREISAAAMEKIVRYHWPGNVRELENIIRRAVILSEHSTLQPEDIDVPVASSPATESFRTIKSSVIAEFERRYIGQLLAAHNGNITAAAKVAQKNRRSFWELMRKHHIDPPRTRRDS